MKKWHVTAAALAFLAVTISGGMAYAFQDVLVFSGGAMKWVDYYGEGDSAMLINGDYPNDAFLFAAEQVVGMFGNLTVGDRAMIKIDTRSQLTEEDVMITSKGDARIALANVTSGDDVRLTSGAGGGKIAISREGDVTITLGE